MWKGLWKESYKYLKLLEWKQMTWCCLARLQCADIKQGACHVHSWACVGIQCILLCMPWRSCMSTPNMHKWHAYCMLWICPYMVCSLVFVAWVLSTQLGLWCWRSWCWCKWRGHPGATLAHCMNVMLHLTRLETRTKESNTCANLWVIIWGVMKMTIGMCALIANQSTVRGLCLSMCIRTRKMVNYAWVEWIQGKLWRRLAAVLTCKSFVILEYRGERLIEPSSSWFPLKFPSG